MNRDNFIINPLSAGQGQEQSPYVSGFAFNYSPEFLKASLNGSYINDRSMQNSNTHAYNTQIQMPIMDSGLSANYGLSGYDSRYSSPYFSQSYRGSSPTYGLNYNNEGFNASVQMQKGRSPYFGINYSKQF